MKIAVTGASGYVARNLRRARHPGISILPITRNRRDRQSAASADLYNSDDIGAANGCDALVHLAGSGRQTVNITHEDSNIKPAQAAIRLCIDAGIRNVVYLSGLGVSARTTLAYLIAKYKAEREIIESGLRYTIFRPSYIVGRGDPLSRVLKGQAMAGGIAIPGSGRYPIQPIHVDDAVRALQEAVTNPRLRNRTFDLVGPEIITYGTYAKYFARMSGAETTRISLEEACRTAMEHPNAGFSIDDLCILAGGFTGDHERLQKASGIRFRSVVGLLKSGSFS